MKSVLNILIIFVIHLRLIFLFNHVLLVFRFKIEVQKSKAQNYFHLVLGNNEFFHLFNKFSLVI